MHEDTGNMEIARVRVAYSERFSFAGSGYYLWHKFPQLQSVQETTSEFNPVLHSSPRVLDAVKPRVGEKLLDIGCGMSFQAGHFREWPCDYYGLDICIEAFPPKPWPRLAQKPAPQGFIQADGRRLPFGTGVFDIVVCVGVIEYYTPAVALRMIQEVGRICRVGARLYLNIPNTDHPFASEMFMIEEARGCPNYPWQQFELEQLLKEAQFDVADVHDKYLMLHGVATRRAYDHEGTGGSPMSAGVRA